MKRYISIIFAAMAVTACLEPIHRNDNLYESAVYFINNGVTPSQPMYDCETMVDVPVYTYCGGFYGGNPEVGVSLDEAAVTVYNADNSTNYKVLPSNCYTLDTGKKKMDDKKATFTLTFDVEALKALSAEDDYSDLDSMVVPLRVKPLSSEATAARDDRYNVTMVNPDLRQMSFVFDEEGKGSTTYDDIEKTADGDVVLKYTVRTLIPNQWENTVNFQFNTGDTTAAGVPLPEGSYQVQASADKFSPGVSEITYTVTIKDNMLTTMLYNIVAEVGSTGGFVLDGSGVSTISYRTGTQYPFSKMDIKAYNSANSETKGEQNAPWNMLDESSYFWHNSWGQGTGAQPAPWWVTVELEDSLTVIGYVFEERNDGNNWTDNKSGFLAISTDNEAFTTVSTFDFGTAQERKDNPDDYLGGSHSFSIPEDVQAPAKYVKIAFDASNRSNSCNVRVLRLYYKANTQSAATE